MRIVLTEAFQNPNVGRSFPEVFASLPVMLHRFPENCWIGVATAERLALGAQLSRHTRRGMTDETWQKQKQKQTQNQKKRRRASE